MGHTTRSCLVVELACVLCVCVRVCVFACVSFCVFTGNRNGKTVVDGGMGTPLDGTERSVWR